MFKKQPYNGMLDNYDTDLNHQIYSFIKNILFHHNNPKMAGKILRAIHL